MICRHCGRPIDHLRPPDSYDSNAGLESWRVSGHGEHSVWVTKQKDGRFYETTVRSSSLPSRSRWLSREEAEQLIAKSQPHKVEWGKG